MAKKERGRKELEKVVAEINKRLGSGTAELHWTPLGYEIHYNNQ